MIAAIRALTTGKKKPPSCMAAHHEYRCGLLAVHLVHRTAQALGHAGEHGFHVRHVVGPREFGVLLTDGLVALDKQQQLPRGGVTQFDAPGDLAGAQGRYLVALQ